MLGKAVALRAQWAKLGHLVVDLLEPRNAARFEHGEKLHEHLRHGHRVVRGAVMVELRKL